MRTIGIDPGKDGALVVVDGVAAMAILRFRDFVPKGADWMDAVEPLGDAMRDIARLHGPELIVMERDAGRPGEGAGSARTIGRGWGIVRGLLYGCGVPVLVPTSAKWTRAMHADVPGTDAKARSVYIARGAGVALTRGRETRPHDGVADAYCLARYGAHHALVTRRADAP